MSQRLYDWAWMGLMAGWYVIAAVIFALAVWRG
jgi:hypothetical protein